MRATYPVQPFLLYLIILTLFHDEYKLWRSTFCNFYPFCCYFFSVKIPSSLQHFLLQTPPIFVLLPEWKTRFHTHTKCEMKQCQLYLYLSLPIRLCEQYLFTERNEDNAEGKCFTSSCGSERLAAGSRPCVGPSVGLTNVCILHSVYCPLLGQTGTESWGMVSFWASRGGILPLRHWLWGQMNLTGFNIPAIICCYGDSDMKTAVGPSVEMPCISDYVTSHRVQRFSTPTTLPTIVGYLFSYLLAIKVSAFSSHLRWPYTIYLVQYMIKSYFKIYNVLKQTGSA
jgi:hypothetical protein